MYKVIKYFTDLQDNNHAYNVGDIFPHDGMEVTENRIKELSTDINRRHMPLIEEVAETETAEPFENLMNPPEEPEEAPEEEPEEAVEATKKKRGRPRNDAQ